MRVFSILGHAWRAFLSTASGRNFGPHPVEHAQVFPAFGRTDDARKILKEGLRPFPKDTRIMAAIKELDAGSSMAADIQVHQVGDVKITITRELVTAVKCTANSHFHLRGKPEECSLWNRGLAGSGGRATLHFGSHGFTGVTKDVAEALAQTGVKDFR